MEYNNKILPRNKGCIFFKYEGINKIIIVIIIINIIKELLKYI